MNEYTHNPDRWTVGVYRSYRTPVCVEIADTAQVRMSLVEAQDMHRQLTEAIADARRMIERKTLT